jgi:sigma-54 dependent transcriptional regulator, acetoin dehydrogenase operon transcriptional activator AcoR
MFSHAPITLARRSVLEHGIRADLNHLKPWLAASWQRCLQSGMGFSHPASFEPIGQSRTQYLLESNQTLISVARPTMMHLGGLVSGMGYFAMLTDSKGTVIDVAGQVDRHDPQAAAIARVGVDLSEASIGTSAIGAALFEQQRVALHREEHFLAATSMFTCVGAPVFDPTGRCVGMLDLTGIQVREHPHLLQLVSQMAELMNVHWLNQTPHDFALSLSWPALDGSDSDVKRLEFGQILIDSDGVICAASSGARQTLPELQALCTRSSGLHLSELFARPWLEIAALSKKIGKSIGAPLWSGLAIDLTCVPLTRAAPATDRKVPMEAVKVALIKQAVLSARGNVNEAADRLGISRATIYRVLGKRR